MYLLTAHRTFVANNADGLFQVPLSQTEDTTRFIIVGGVGLSVGEGPLAGFTVSEFEDGVSLKSPDGTYLCAEADGRTVRPDRPAASLWEKFVLVEESKVPVSSAYQEFNISAEREIARLGRVVSDYMQKGWPVCLYMGCGPVPRPLFLNVDRVVSAPSFAFANPTQYFIFPFADMPWGLPDNCVDYVFDEDFIEHVSQLQQIQYLAECRRVLKPGCYHRVNTPNLIAAMRRHSDFSRGFSGVYTGEKRWGHESMFTPWYLKEMAEMVGYREVVFTTRDRGVSRYAQYDHRPAKDRDEIVGNIYADLMK